MIHSLYIIDNGMCIYKHIFQKDKTSEINEQLLTGFLNALGLFAENTFQKRLQSIQIQEGEKLSFYVQKKDDLVFCVVSDELDDSNLLQKIIKRIANEFSFSMQEILHSNQRSQLDKYNSFDEKLISLMRFKGHKRNKTSFLLGISLSILFLIGALFIFLEFFLSWLLILFGEDNFLPVFIFIGLSLFLSGILSGYIAGDTKLGIFGGLLSFFGFVIFSYIVINELFNLMIIVLPLDLIICIFSGYFGGLLCNRRKLYKY